MDVLPSGGFPQHVNTFGSQPMSNFGAPANNSDHTRFKGVVKSFERDRGSGYIESEPARALYGNDILFLVGAFPIGRDPIVGEEIEFGVIMSNSGPQACSVACSSNPIINSAPVAADPASGRFLGVVKTFDMNKGWGHIECREARSIFGKDIFLLRSMIKGAEVANGNQLEFSVKVGPKGPMAQDVCLVDYGPTLADAAHYRRLPSVFYPTLIIKDVSLGDKA